MFPTVAETLGEVCSCGRELCRRQLGLKPRKSYLLHILWSVRILFNKPRILAIRSHVLFEGFRKKTHHNKYISKTLVREEYHSNISQNRIAVPQKIYYAE